MIREVKVRTTQCPLLGNLVLLGKEILGGKKKTPGASEDMKGIHFYHLRRSKTEGEALLDDLLTKKQSTLVTPKI